MRLNTKRSLLFLSIMLILILGVTMVSATEVDTNNAQGTTENISLSTPNDVDKVVQSDIATSSNSDADVEITSTSDISSNANNINEETETIKVLNSKNIAQKENNLKATEITVHSYTELRNVLQSGSYPNGEDITINLEAGDYNSTGLIELPYNSQYKVNIWGNGITIDCNNNPFLKYDNHAGVTLNNMTITNSAGSYTVEAGYSSEYVRAYNVKFINNNANHLLYAGWNCVEGIQVIECDFINNNNNASADNSIMYSRNSMAIACNFINNTKGHMVWATGVINIMNCYFGNNTGNKGTCIDFIDQGMVDATICYNTFEGNHATDIGGVFYINNDITGSEVDIFENIIINNSAQRGGVFGVEKGTVDTHIYDNLIENNTANSKGVIVDSMNARANIRLENNTIRHNIIPDNGQRDDMEDCLFYNQDGSIVLVGNLITENIGNGTSCLFNYRGDLQLYNNTITSNKVAGASIFYVTPEGGQPKLTMNGNMVGFNEIVPTPEYHPWIFNFATRSWISGINITNNTFINNTVIPVGATQYEDVLFSPFPPSYQYPYVVSNNDYLHNALNITDNGIVGRSQDNDNIYLTYDVDLREVYNSTVTNGTVHLSANGIDLGVYLVEFDDNGQAVIVLPKSELPSGVTMDNINGYFVSYYKHYQNYEELNITRLTLTASPTSTTVGGVVTLSGQLVDMSSNNRPISGATIVITVGNDTYTTTTDSNGYYSIQNTTVEEGVIPVTAVFNLNGLFETSSARTSFTVSDAPSIIPTNITIDVNNIIVGETNTITLTLHNTSGQVISGKTVSYTITGEGISLSGSNTTVNGIITIDYIAQNNTSITITASFAGETDVYSASTNTTTVNSEDIQLIPTNITIDVSDSLEVNKSTDIVFTLHNTTGNVISGKTLEIVIGSNTYTQSTDSNGKVTIPYTPQDNSNIIINVEFAGDNVYNNSDNTTTIQSSQISLTSSTITVNANDAYLNNYVIITGTLNNATNGAIVDADVVLTFSNGYQSQTVRTNANGEFSYNLNGTIVGTFTVTATYNGVVNKVQGDSANDTFTVTDKAPSELIITTDSAHYWVDENVDITVELLSGDSDKINVTIGNDATQEVSLINGKYTITVNYDSIRNITVVASVAETEDYLSDETNESFEIVKIPTTTEITILNNTAGYASFYVIVTGADGNIINNGILFYSYKGNTFNVTMTSTNTTIYLTDLTSIADDVYVSVLYNGSNKYNSSRDDKTSPVIGEIPIITIDLNNTIYVHDSNVISGNLTNSAGLPIPNRQINIKIIDENDNEVDYKPFTDDNGHYSITYDSEVVGHYTVVVTYIGNQSIAETSNQSQFDVVKIPTKTIAGISNNTTNNVQISVNITDARNNEPVTKGNVTIIINPGSAGEITIRKEINSTENIIELDDITTIDTVTVEVKYEENSEYEESNVTVLTFTPVLMKSNLTINVTPSVVLNDPNTPVVLNGKLVDELGNGIKGTIYLVFDSYYEPTSVTIVNDDGTFTTNIPNTSVGNFTVTASYAGLTNSINGSSTNADFKVTKIPTITNIVINGETGDIVNLLINVQNRSSDYVSTGNIILYSNNVELLTIDLSQETYNNINNSRYIQVDIDLDDYDSIDNFEEIVAVYQENTEYLGSRDTANINNVKSNATILVTATPSVYINDTVNIAVELRGANNYPIKGSVELYINNVYYTSYTLSDEDAGIWRLTYNNSVAGTYNVEARFTGNALYDAVSDDTQFNIQKIPTKTIVSVHNNSWGNASIDIVVQDNRTNNVITYGNISISIENTDIPNTVLNSSGTTNVPIETQTPNNFNIAIHYLENDAYLGSQGVNELLQPFTNISITSHKSIISVSTNNSNPYVGDVMRIYGYLYDENTGAPIGNSIVHITARGSSIGDATTDENGYYYMDYTTQTNGTNYVITVLYPGINVPGVSNILSSYNNTTYNVTKIPTDTVIDIKNSTVNNVTIGVKVYEFIDDHRGALVTEGNKLLNVTVGTHSVLYDITGEETIIKLADITDLSQVTINVTYIGNNRYLDSSAQINDFVANRGHAIITVHAQPNETYVGNTIYISGTLHDGLNNPINGRVFLTFHDEYGDPDEHAQVNVTNGFYEYERGSHFTGVITVTASFFNATTEYSEATTNYTILKIPTNTTVTVHNNTKGNVSIDVSVIDYYHEPITNGTLNITVDGTPINDYEFNGEVVNIPINSDSDNIQVTVVYNGNVTYDSSIGKTSDKVEFTNITTKNQTANLTVYANPEHGYLGIPVTINGTLVDGLGNNITDTVITLTFDNGTVVETVDNVNVNNGVYEFNRITHVTGTIAVTAYYAGNGSIDPITATTQYTINQIPTETIVEIINNTIGNVIINVTVIDNTTKEALEEGNITITIDDGISDVKTINDLIFDADNCIFELDIPKIASYTISVNYLGNYTYQPSIGVNTTTISRQRSHITVSANNTVSVGQAVVINGTLYDGLNNTIAGKTIDITIEGSSTQLHHQTDENGKYSVIYYPNHDGEFTVTVTWVGDDNRTTCSNNTQFNVVKIPTKTNVSVLNNTVGNISLLVDVVDNETNPITVGVDKLQITIIIDGETIIKTYDIAGTTTEISLSDVISDVGDYEIKVEYLGNDTYESSYDQTFDNITVVSQQSSITVNVRPTSYIGEFVNITGTLVDGMGNIIPNAPLTITFKLDGEVIDQITSVSTKEDGTYEYPRITNTLGNVEVIVNYTGNSNIKGCQNSANCVVSKIPTNTTIVLASNTLDNVIYEIWFTDRRNGNTVNEGIFQFIINRTENSRKNYTLDNIEQYGDNLTVDENGHYYLRVDESFFNPDITPYAYVTYYGNDKYASSSNYTGQMPVKGNLTIEVTVNQSSTYINESVDIHIRLLNSENNPQNGRVKVTVGNTTIYTQDELGYITDELIVSSGGGLTIPYMNNTKGLYNITVEYLGSGAWNSGTGNNNFTILPLPTETRVKVINNTIGNIWIEFTVKDTRNNEYVHYGTVDVVYGGEHHNIAVNTTGDTNRYLIDIENPGQVISVSVDYLENDKYTFSEGIDDDTLERFTNITLSKQTAILTIDVDHNVSYLGDEIIISGQLINPTGDVARKEIDLTIKGVISETSSRLVTDENGYYSYRYDGDFSITRGNGTFNVTVYYSGNESVNTAINNTNFTVNKIPTKTIITLLNNTVGNVTVGVEVIETIRNNDKVVGGAVFYYDENGTNFYATNVELESSSRLPITTSGNIIITAKYVENNIYLESEAYLDDETLLENITVINQTATILIDVEPTTVEIGETVTINGTLKDGMGEYINGENIVDILIDNEVYHVNVTNGKFSLVNITYTQGIKKVNATYIGSATIDAITSETKNFTVNLIPTKTLVSVENSTVGNVSISVNVTNNTGDIVTTGELKVTVGDNTPFTVNVDSSGETVIPLTDIKEMGDINVIVEYQANPIYNSSIGIDASTVNGTEEEFNNITPTKHQTILIVDVENSPVKIGQNVTINGTLYLDNGTAMDNVIVTIAIGNRNYEATVTDGQFKLNYTTNQVTDQRIVTARYAGNDNDINGSEDTTSFVVEKLPTSINTDVLSRVIGNVTLNVTVTDTINDVIVTNRYNSSFIQSIIEVEYNGVVHNFTVNGTGHTIIRLTDLTAPVFDMDISIRYRENNVYLGCTDDMTKLSVIGQTPTITVNATPEISSVGDVVTITGVLTDAFGYNIADKEIIVSINGTTLRNNTNINGRYTVYYISQTNGTFTVLAAFNGNSTVYAANATTNFTVNKIPTTTNMNLLNNTVGNVTINVSVYDNETNPITDGQFIVTIEELDKTFTVNIEGENTIVPLNITEADKEFTVTVNYPGTNKYIESIGKNNTDQETYITFTTVKQNATITVDAVPKEAFVGHVVEISGTLYDGMNNPITGKINLTFNGDEATEVNVTDGRFVYQRTSHITGEVNVTAIYLGNETINSCNASVIYIIDKIPTATEITALNVTRGNLTIAVKVTDSETGFTLTTDSNLTITHVDEYGEIIVDSPVLRIDLNEDADKFTIDGFGRIVIKLDDEFISDHDNIIVIYEGNDVYLASNDTDEEDVVKDETKLTVTLNETLIYINQTIEVTVNLTNSQNIPISGKVNLTIGNITKEIEIDSTGIYKVDVNEFDLEFNTNTSGVYNVVANYTGNDIQSNATDNASFTIKKLPTETRVVLINNTYGNVTIDIVVNDTVNDKIITEGTFRIVLNGKVQDPEPVTGEVTRIKLHPETTGFINIEIYYLETESYELSRAIDNTTSERLDIIEIIPQVANLTVIAEPNATYVGETITISGKLVDGLNNSISDVRIYLNVGGTVYEGIFTDESGEYTIQHTTVREGNYTVTAEYKGNFTVDPCIATVNYTVSKLNTTTIVEVLNNSAGNVTIRVNVTDQLNRPVDHGTFTLNVENQPSRNITIDGNETIVLLDIDNEGTFNVNVTYLGDEQYNPSNGTDIDDITKPFTEITVMKQEVNLTVGTFRNHVPVTTGMVISGYLLNASGLPVVDATITLTFNSEDAVNVTTNSLGYYTHERLVHIPGNVTVVAYYEGNDKYNEATADTSYIGEKLPTNTTVEIVNNTVGNFHIAVEVWDMYHNSLIDSGVVNITINNGTVKQYELEDTHTVIFLEEIISVNNTNISVVYIGNDTYLSSIGITKDSFGDENETFTNITADKQNATLTIKEGPSPVYVFNNITYNGTLVDGLGNNITGKINLIIYHDDIIVRTIEDVPVNNGFYEYNRTSLVVGNIVVVAEYAGNETINPINASTTYVINKRPTTTLVEVVNDTIGNLTVDVQILDKLNNSIISDGGYLISLTINEGTFTYDITGEVTRIQVPVENNRNYVAIIVRYLGNDTYEPSTGIVNATYPDTNETFNNITSKVHNASLSIEVTPVNSTVGTIYNISGNFLDTNGTAIVGANIVIKIDGTRFAEFTTVENGYYSVNYTSYKEGNFTVDVTFGGNDIINETSNTTTFKVNKIPTNTIVRVINNTVGHVEIAVNVTDVDGTPITKGDLEVTVDGVKETVKIKGDETVIELDIDTVETVEVSVKYPGNDTYIESNGMNASDLTKEVTEITADKDHAQISVEVIPDDVYVGDKVRIIVYLDDMDELPIRGAPINITIYDQDGNVLYSENSTTPRNGMIRLDRTELVSGNLTVNASYESDTIDYVSAEYTYTVNKIPTTTTVDILNNTLGNVTISVRVMDNIDNIPITEGNLTLTVDGETKNIAITGRDTVILINSTESNIEISVEYPGNDTYINSTGKTRDGEDLTNITTVNSSVLITINIDRPEIYVGEYITINGLVTFADGKTLVNEGKVIVRLNNGTEYVYETVNDYLSGINRQYFEAGTYTVTATYVFDDEEIVTSESKTFTVNKIPTTTLVSIENTTVGNVSINVEILDNENKSVLSGEVEVTTPNKTFRVNITEKTTNIPLNITTTGNISVSVKYIENDVYLNSTGVDKESYEVDPVNPEEFTEITVTKRNTTITLITETPVKTVNNTTISGKLVDENNIPIEGASVVIIVDGEENIRTTDADGLYTLTLENAVVGTHNVTVVYEGNDTFIGSTDNATFVVEKTTANLTVDEISNTTIGENVTITGKLVDEFGTPITNADINVTVDERSEIVQTDENGNYIATIPTDKVGELSVTVNFTGNDKYDGARENDTLNVVPVNAIIEVSVPENSTPNHPGNISGNVTDEDGNPIGNLPINVTVNNVTYPTTTDENGTFTVPIDEVVPGENNVTVTGGNDTVSVDPVEDTFTAGKDNATLIVDPVDEVTAGQEVNITGKLVDDEGNPIAGVEVNITVGNETQTVTTDDEGNYNGTFPADTVGEIPVVVEFGGNDNYNPAKEEDSISVVPVNAIIEVSVPENSTPNHPGNISGNVTDEDGNPIGNLPINVTVNNVTYPTTTDENGTFVVPIDEVVPGENNVTVTGGNDTVSVDPVEDSFTAGKDNATLTVDPIEATHVGDTPIVTGTLTDNEGNPIKDAEVTVKVNNDTYTAITDENGNFEVEVSNTTLGENNVTVMFEDEKYNPTSANTSFELSKLKTRVVVNKIEGIVGEDITLTARVYDENGELVTGGNLVFKLNGLTLKTDGRFGSKDAGSMKFKVVDGVVTFTIKADLYLRNGKNVTATYGGSSKYESSVSNVAKANIKKRNATLEVTVIPTNAKQNTDITISVKLKDVTPNGKNTTSITDNGTITLKVNDVTLKNDDGTIMQIPVEETVTNYVYHIPKGRASVDSKGNIIDYNVTAIYISPEYYQNTKNSTTFHVDKSITNINFESTTVNNDVLSIKANITDYENNYVVGPSKICVKINGKTYQEDGEVKYFTVNNGKVDLTGIKLDSGKPVKTVMIVVGERQAYYSSRATTSDISTI